MGIGPNNEKVAVKFERHGTRCPQLRHEYKVYRELTNCHGFCSVYHFGTQDNYNVMVMDLLGPSLEDLFNKCNRRFSLKTVLQIADQMLERVDTLHSRHLIHRDIKPANFVIGVAENAANIYCVDFGLSKRYRHPKNLHHIPHRDGRSLTGTPRYASINNHLGIEQSRRDDLESIGYVLIYFLKGTLPWQGLKAKNAQKKYRLILEKKQQVSIAQLCQGCPSQFAEFLAYTRSLKFDAKPDIPYLRKLFRDLYHAQGCGSIPKLWDWDGMEGNDYLSASGSAGGVGGSNGQGPVGMMAAQPQQVPLGVGGLTSGLRPTTAAAVANPGAGVGMVDDMMLGSAAPDDLDVDYEMRNTPGNDRPNTAGAMYNRGAAVPQQNQQTWGYSRQDPNAAMMSKGGVSGPILGAGAPVADYGTDNGAPRRPHTAHGGRAGFPTTQQQLVGGVYGGNGTGMMQQQALVPVQQGQYVDGEEDGDGHVVAGARGMMRYRRNRASTLEGGQGVPAQGAPQQQQLPSQGIGYGVGAGSSGAPWAMYQQNSGQKQVPTGVPMQAGWSQQGGAQAGYATADRPKSANFTGGGSNPITSSAGGLMASLTGAGRPSSSNMGAAQAGTGWGASVGMAGAQQQAVGQNRFLSGASKNNNGAATATSSGANHSATSAKSGAKLFSLAR